MESSAPHSEPSDIPEEDSGMLKLPPLHHIPVNLPPPRVLPVDITSYSPQLSEWSPSSVSEATSAPTSLRLIAWNVDFMTPHAERRVSCILDHLRDTVLSGFSGSSCILLQELKEESFDEVLRNDWVCEHYAVTPPDRKSWMSYYGLATLVSRDIRAANAQMVQFASSIMGRVALLVDLEMSVSADTERSEGSSESPVETRVVRIANTHLESLPMGEKLRPLQLQTVAEFLREETATGGGLVGGDMNMIGPADQDIHVRAGLQDACDDPSAVTWGFQPQTEFPPGRLDRIFSVGEHLEVAPVDVIGKGLKVSEGGSGSGEWATDHYGLMTTIKLRCNS